jgi:hypothetical protein
MMAINSAVETADAPTFVVGQVGDAGAVFVHVVSFRRHWDAALRSN